MPRVHVTGLGWLWALLLLGKVLEPQAREWSKTEYLP